MSSETQEIKRIIIKSPLIPLFQRGKLLFPPFRRLFPAEGRQGRLGGIL